MGAERFKQPILCRLLHCRPTSSHAVGRKVFAYEASLNNDFSAPDSVYSGGTNLWMTADDNDTFGIRILLLVAKSQTELSLRIVGVKMFMKSLQMSVKYFWLL